MQYAKGDTTPVTARQKLITYESDAMKDVQLYRSIVGALQCANIIRLEKYKQSQ